MLARGGDVAAALQAIEMITTIRNVDAYLKTFFIDFLALFSMYFNANNLSYSKNVGATKNKTVYIFLAESS